MNVNIYRYNIWELQLNETALILKCDSNLTDNDIDKEEDRPDNWKGENYKIQDLSTTLTFYYQYTEFVPMLQDYDILKNKEIWRNDDNLPLQIVWNNNITSNQIYNFVIYKENEAERESGWLRCFEKNTTENEIASNNWQTQRVFYSMFPYYGNESDNETIVELFGDSEQDNEMWDYTLNYEIYEPLVLYNGCNQSLRVPIWKQHGFNLTFVEEEVYDEDENETTIEINYDRAECEGECEVDIYEGDKLADILNLDNRDCEPNTCCHYRNSWSGSFNIYFWYNDDVWTNKLTLYQTLTQNAIMEAICDLYNEKNTDILEPNDFIVEVTFFFNFCLFKDDCPDLAEDKELADVVFYPSNIETAGYPGYRLKSTYRSNVDKAEKIYDLLTENPEEFIENVQRRAKENYGRYNFKVYGVGIDALPRRIKFKVPLYVSYGVYAFVGCCVLFAIIGSVHGFVYWGADCIRMSGIVYFGLYTWDFYSDIVFDLELLNYDDTEILFYLCTAFIAIPWISNMISLSKYQQKWCKDDAIRERVYSWFVSWQRLTYALAAISGSAFGTVELANSYFFGADFFCMGLNERHLKRFNNNRLWSGIIAENVPQLIIQFWFLAILDWDPPDGIYYIFPIFLLFVYCCYFQIKQRRRGCMVSYCIINIINRCCIIGYLFSKEIVCCH